MSFVEKALKKLQEKQQNPTLSRDTLEARATTVVGRVEAVEERSHTREHSVARRTDRIIKIDRVALQESGLLPPAQQTNHQAHEYRAIKRPLVSAALGRSVEKVPKAHLIMVASALPGEGKSFTCMNLALSIALEKGVSVLLVDADLAKPHISTTFGVRKELGLLDALSSPDLDVESLVIPTDIPNLSVLPAGTAMETATELLASDRMNQIAARLGEIDPRRIILFDSPPLLLTSESRVLADVVGQILVVVRAGSTDRNAVLESLALLPDNKSIQLVLNQSETPTHGEYYGYGDYGAASVKE